MYKPFVIPSSVWVWLLGAKYESSTPRTTVIMRPHRKETGHTEQETAFKQCSNGTITI